MSFIGWQPESALHDLLSGHGSGFPVCARAFHMPVPGYASLYSRDMRRPLHAWNK